MLEAEDMSDRLAATIVLSVSLSVLSLTLTLIGIS